MYLHPGTAPQRAGSRLWSPPSLLWRLIRPSRSNATFATSYGLNPTSDSTTSTAAYKVVDINIINAAYRVKRTPCECVQGITCRIPSIVLHAVSMVSPFPLMTTLTPTLEDTWEQPFQSTPWVTHRWNVTISVPGGVQTGPQATSFRHDLVRTNSGQDIPLTGNRGDDLVDDVHQPVRHRFLQCLRNVTTRCAVAQPSDDAPSSVVPARGALTAPKRQHRQTVDGRRDHSVTGA